MTYQKSIYPNVEMTCSTSTDVTEGLNAEIDLALSKKDGERMIKELHRDNLPYVWVGRRRPKKRLQQANGISISGVI